MRRVRTWLVVVNRHFAFFVLPNGEEEKKREKRRRDEGKASNARTASPARASRDDRQRKRAGEERRVSQGMKGARLETLPEGYARMREADNRTRRAYGA